MWVEYYLRSSADHPPLKIGLLLDGLTLAGPFAEVLKHIQASNFAAIHLLVLNAEATPPVSPQPRSGYLSRALRLLQDRRRRQGLLFDWYERWDRRCQPEAARALAPVDCSALLRGVERLEVTPQRKGFVQRFPPEALVAIREKDLDVLLRFGFGILRGDILHCARYGVWSYHHGDNDYYRGGPAHFWELYERNPLSGVMLQVLTEQLDAGRVLCRAFLATEPGLSLVRNRLRPYLTAVPFVIAKLHELHQLGWDHLERRMLPPRPYRGRRSLYRKPTNLEMCRFLVPRLAGKALRRLTRPGQLVHHWRVALRTGPQHRLDPASPVDFSGFRWIEPPAGHFYADPFLLTKAGRTWLFFEDYLYAESRGVISCAAVSPDGTLSGVRRVLDLPYHLSYPFLCEDQGEVFMIPETAQDHTVRLFRALDFPGSWKPEKVLFQGHAADTTLWRQDGFYWFFTSVADRPEAGQSLLLFSAKSLTGEWAYHPANPISLDVRTARSAGALFRAGGRLIRPCQDGSAGYGCAINFQEILKLDPSDYLEQPLGTARSSWARGLVGTHTYNRTETVEVLDGCILVPRARVAERRDPPHAGWRPSTSW